MTTAKVGRPAVGSPIQIRIPAAMVEAIDRAAAAAGVTRSEWIRQACAERLPIA